MVPPTLLSTFFCDLCHCYCYCFRLPTLFIFAITLIETFLARGEVGELFQSRLTASSVQP